jgi:hypothetical protein
MFFFLFFVSTISVTAQETHIYKQMLNESLKPDFMMMDIPLEIDSSMNNNAQIFKDVNEENLYRMLYRHRIEFLLPEEKRIPFEDKKSELSPYATLFFYTNAKNEPLDNGKFNGDGSFSGEFATKGDILLSKATRVMVPVPGLFLLLATQTGIIPVENLNVKKESKKAKALRTITKDVYHIDD